MAERHTWRLHPPEAVPSGGDQQDWGLKKQRLDPSDGQVRLLISHLREKLSEKLEGRAQGKIRAGCENETREFCFSIFGYVTTIRRRRVRV